MNKFIGKSNNKPWHIPYCTHGICQKKGALTLCLEGFCFRAIGRIPGFTHVAVYNWIKAFGSQIESLKEKEAIIVEMDDLSWIRRSEPGKIPFH